MSTSVATTQLEKRIAQDLAPFDAVEAEIAKVKEEYQGLKINGPDDKDGYKMVHSAWQHVRGIRLGAEKLHGAISEDAKVFKQACDARLRQVKNGLASMEEDFYAQWKAEDTRKEREKEEARLKAEQEAAQRIEARKGMLYSMGLTWNGAAYAHALNVGTISEGEVTGLDDGPFAEMVAEIGERLSEAKEVAAKQEAARLEAERIAKEEAAKQAAIAAENERRAKELEAQQAAMEAESQRKANEIAAREAAMNAKVEDARANELKAIGANGLEVPMRPYAQYTDEQWTAHIESSTTKVAARQKAEAEAAAKAEQERKWKEEEIRAKAVADEQARVARAAKETEEIEAERLRQAGDKGAVEAILSGLTQLQEIISKVTLKSAKTKAKMAHVSGFIDQATNALK